ncbi:MAG: glutamate synthase large subunit [Spirochaetes bacterium]|nr:glutamate synthase large subunit [Spirochaetota bacterium]
MFKKKGLYDPQYEHDSCGVGFVVNIDGDKDHKIIKEGIEILKNLEHRGAVGGDAKTGDGAGMLLQIPHQFFSKIVKNPLPKPGHYGAGMVFLKDQTQENQRQRNLIEHIIKSEGGQIIQWRLVPTNPDCLGKFARQSMPRIWQFFVTFPELADENLERKLYICRKLMENKAIGQKYEIEEFYIPSLSSQIIVYKGMFVSKQFVTFYPDLMDPDFKSAFSLVHQRYSTNTMPSWPLAQPFRGIAHNGEINTIRRNMNNMLARESSLESEIFGNEIKKLTPIVRPGMSDSAIFDNVFELLSLGGRSIEHSMMMMVPEAFGTKYHISQDKRCFFEYHAATMEPWDGPAAIAFTDGKKIGAALDRNGLRPCRYVITKNKKMIVASETGVVDIPAQDVLEKGRLAPGKMIMVDLERKRVMKDNEIKSNISRQKPYRRWLEENKIELKGLFGVPRPVELDMDELANRQRAFGYTLEDIQKIIMPMVENAQEPVGSMGNDASLAVLSDQPQLLYNYFRQMFAQVTNPPIDPYRENLVMSLMSFIGREQNLLTETPQHCHQLKLPHPILTNDDVERLRNSEIKELQAATVDMVFDIHEGKGQLALAIEQMCEVVKLKIQEGYSLIILSDRNISKNIVPIPALLAVAAVDQYLVKHALRHLAGIIIETGEAREVHHFATLISYGASAINPYLVFETMTELKERGYISEETTIQNVTENYILAVKKGLLKVMSKMGISTIRSYKGSQIYEVIGLNESFTKAYFGLTPSQISGIGLAEIEQQTIQRHLQGYTFDEIKLNHLDSGGQYFYRNKTEKHLFTPQALVLLQKAVRAGDYQIFKEYSREVNNFQKNLCTLRGLFQFKSVQSIPIEEVEPASEIVKRFVSSAMSFGSLSKEAHETIAIAMNRLGAMSNCGEGGEDEQRYQTRNNGDLALSKVKQIASGRFGVTSHYLANAEELQIKMAQGAKPGEGGQLPGHKVDEVIARVRNSTPGVMLISPPPHHDIYSIEDLAQLIYDLRCANAKARVSVKLVSEIGVGTIAAGVAKAKADMVLISGCDGGTGASPLSSIKYAGSWWEIGLAETQQVLVMNNLRDKIRVQVDGQIKTGRDIVIGALLGAEEFGFATTVLVSLGCIMMRKCHLNSCPVGIATQNKELRNRFRGKPEHLMNFMLFLAEEVREIMADLGMLRFDDLVGRVDLLEVNEAIQYYKTRGLDFSKVLLPPAVPEKGALRCMTGQSPDFSLALDPEIIKQCQNTLENQKPMELSFSVKNCNRTIGAALSYEVSRRYGSTGLKEDTLTVDFHGSAGQSFGAFLAQGITFRLKGDANDYLGKGLSGGKIIVSPEDDSTFIPERNIITGNVNLFGATSGEVYINGMAGERFAVRNSGATAVVEGVGDHGCEYMTGGIVIILGKTGINFAAGMSGGIAYVLDENQLFDNRCNLEMVDIEPIINEQEQNYVKKYITNHYKYTKSSLAQRILDKWEETLPLFVKVIPIDYRKALERLKAEESREDFTVGVTEEVYV